MRAPVPRPEPSSPPTSRPTSKGASFLALLAELTKVHAVLLRTRDALAAPARLNSARVHVLALVDRSAASVAQIARDKSLTRQTVQQTADALVDEGYAEYRDNPNHQRAKLLAITAKGKKALLAVDEEQTAWANGIAGDLTLKELDAAVALLRQVHANVLDDT